mgnify:CR=1 FL=1
MTILLNTSIVSSAQGVAGATSTISVTYNNAESGLCYGNTYLPWNWNIDSSMYYENTDSQSVFWYKGKNLTLFTSSSDFYGYQIQVSRTSSTVNTSESARQKFWCIGTAGQLMQGENRGGTITSTSFTAWVPTNNSIQSVHMAPMYQFSHSFDLDYDGALEDGDDLVAYDEWGSYEINAKYTVKYTGYKTKSAYDSAMNEIKTELEDQTEELGDINTELDNQTEELEEQTETQKGILSTISGFFGSFFDNLKNSVIGLFVPSKEEMGELFNRLNQFFSDTFGFLYYPFDVFVRFVEVITTSESEVVLTLPGFSIMGHTVWEDITYNFGRVTLLQNIGEYAKIGSGAIIVFAFINYLRNFFDKRFGGGGT